MARRQHQFETWASLQMIRNFKFHHIMPKVCVYFVSWSPQKNTARIGRIGLLTTGFTTHSSHAITSFFSLFALANLAREFLYLLMEAYSLPPYLLYVIPAYLGRLRIFIYIRCTYFRGWVIVLCNADSCKWSKHFFVIFPIPQSAEDDTLKADVLF